MSIVRLSADVVNRIAAGEVIQRPVNAIKEMLENSLDAKATIISLIIKDGGLKLIQLQDNGSGIHKEDLPLVCERFATSKLKSYRDLDSIGTYGFRGEALASISHIAHVTLTTKTKDSECAWKAHYSDGILAPAKPGATSEPKAVAGNEGTQIIVQDLFYNVENRRKGLKNHSEEYHKILDVMQRYAVHNSHVAISCKKSGSSPDLSTPASSILETIANVYGSALSKELLEISFSSDLLDFSTRGFISNANYSSKKMIMLLFMNNRLVDSPRLKRQIEILYATHLPKGSHPFVYLSLDLKKDTVDVNVHPTKREVHFLNEDKIIVEVCENIQNCLSGASASRTFTVQPITAFTQNTLPFKAVNSTSTASPQVKRPFSSNRSQHNPEPMHIDKSPKRVPTISANKLVRGGITIILIKDSRMQTLDSFLISTKATQATKLLAKRKDRESIDDSQEEQMIFDSPRSVKDDVMSNRKFVEVRLDSILILREEYAKRSSTSYSETIHDHIWVGYLDEIRALIQHKTRLLIVNFRELSFHFFHQLFLSSFSNFGVIKLLDGLDIKELVIIALDHENPDQWLDKGMPSKLQISILVSETLMQHRDMLMEYFSLCISEDGLLTGIPLVLKDYKPSMVKLPAFLIKLHTDVTWTEEKDCFDMLCKEFASFYTTDMDGLADSEGGYQEMVEHVLFPSMKRFQFMVPKDIEPSTIGSAVNLPDLYRVFERC